MSNLPTIFALSTAPGRAAVAVVRVSGSGAGEILDRLAPGGQRRQRPEPRRAVLRTVRDPVSGEPLDRALVLWLPGPGSETGEDMAEFHLHGGPAVVRAVLAGIGTLPGCRLAEPGEFTRRAFLAGRIDLTEVEGLADLVNSETEGQRKQAMAQADGVLRRVYDGWRTGVLGAMALMEAAIDFADEGDVALDAVEKAHGEVVRLVGQIETHLDDGHRGEIVRDGFRVVLAGAPNAGKSSLFNALVQREAAIVSPEPGTTRDVIEVHLDVGGAAVILADTAGLRDAAGPVEAEGIRRTLASAANANLILWLVDGRDPAWAPPLELRRGPVIVVQTKIDLEPFAVGTGVPGGIVAVSAVTGAGLDALMGRLRAEIDHRLQGLGEGSAVLSQVRHRLALEGTLLALRRFLDDEPAAPELKAEDLREAATALGRITGRVDADAVLGTIFSRFCIGK